MTRFLSPRRSPPMQSSFDARGTRERTNEKTSKKQRGGEAEGGEEKGRERIMDRRTDEGSWSRMRFNRCPGVQGNNHGRLNRPRERYRLTGPNRYHLVSRSGGGGDRRKRKSARPVVIRCNWSFCSGRSERRSLRSSGFKSSVCEFSDWTLSIVVVPRVSRPARFQGISNDWTELILLQAEIVASNRAVVWRDLGTEKQLRL